MQYYTRTKWTDGDKTVSELPFDSIKAAAEHVVSEGDDTPLSGIGGSWVVQCFALHENASGLVCAAQDCTPEFITACYDYWCEDERTYCPQIIYAEVDERFMFDGEVYVIRKGME